MKKTLITLCAVFILLSGCSLKLTGGMALDGYYPEGKTAKGGSFGDPAMSRRESMGPATGQIRNNQNSTDRFLYRITGQSNKIK